LDVLHYKSALAWLDSFINTERTGKFVMEEEDLPRERALLRYLGNPQDTYGVTHIAGTKGKGSVSAIVHSILYSSGVRVGLYTQPGLHTLRECMRVNHQLITEAEILEFVPRFRDALTHMNPALGSYLTYEIVTAMAFLYFREVQVAHAVIEVGLGGRIDATNIVKPMVTAITSISYDHTQALGNTLAEIASQKAGIIKTCVPTICSAQAIEAIDTISNICTERGSQLVRVGPISDANCMYTYQACGTNSQYQLFDVVTPNGRYQGLELVLLGEHQLENATVAIALAEHLREQGLPIDETSIRRGLKEVCWPARLQVVSRHPWIIVDGAHNADSFAKLFAALNRHFTYKRLILVLGTMIDKDIHGMAMEIGCAKIDRIFVTTPTHPRAASPDEIITHLRLSASQQPKVSSCPDIQSALSDALNDSRPDDLVCIVGSLYLAGEALRWLATQSMIKVV
jgi:dihydrofolate synthase / folylpolyglutamate synthase